VCKQVLDTTAPPGAVPQQNHFEIGRLSSRSRGPDYQTRNWGSHEPASILGMRWVYFHKKINEAMKFLIDSRHRT